MGHRYRDVSFFAYFCSMAEFNSIITPHGADSRQSHRFVAGGGTCTCSTVKRHGRLLLKKQLLPEKAADLRHRQALEKEFEVGYTLNHPNIPRYLEWHDDYILMEYVDGLTLTDFVRQHPAYFKQKKQVRQFLDELLSAVDYLHRHQVLHLDLKPDNIMMTHIGNHVKLIDLGYCYQDGFPFSTGGTPGYSAPEKEKTPASDIYSLGRIFSELGIASARVVHKCLRTEATERYQSIDELSAALRRRSIFRQVLVPLFIVLLLGMAGWWWNRGETPQAEPVPMAMEENGTEKAMPEDTLYEIVNRSAVSPPESAREEVKSASDDGNISATRVDSVGVLEQDDSEQEDLLVKNQMKVLPLFQQVTDSILTELRQFVANDRMPYQLGGLETYRQAYESLKNKAIECGKRGDKVPFWIRSHWEVYSGKPKPYNVFDNYLYQQMASIEATFQTRVANFKSHSR